MVNMNDVQDPYEHKDDVLKENVQVSNVEIKSNEKREHITHPNLVEAMRIFN